VHSNICVGDMVAHLLHLGLSDMEGIHDNFDGEVDVG
jgi:hypothetical protein